MFVWEVPGSTQRESIHHPRLLPTHLQGKVLKFPFSGSNTWFSTRANPKPMVNTARVRMKRRVTPNTAAQALNLLAGVEKGCQLWETLKEPLSPLQKQPRVGQGVKQDPGRRVSEVLDSRRQQTPRAGITPHPHPRNHSDHMRHPGSIPKVSGQASIRHPTYSLSLFSSAKWKSRAM